MVSRAKFDAEEAIRIQRDIAKRKNTKFGWGDPEMASPKNKITPPNQPISKQDQSPSREGKFQKYLHTKPPSRYIKQGR